MYIKEVTEVTPKDLILTMSGRVYSNHESHAAIKDDVEYLMSQKGIQSDKQKSTSSYFKSSRYEKIRIKT